MRSELVAVCTQNELELNGNVPPTWINFTMDRVCRRLEMTVGRPHFAYDNVVIFEGDDAVDALLAIQGWIEALDD